MTDTATLLEQLRVSLLVLLAIALFTIYTIWKRHSAWAVDAQQRIRALQQKPPEQAVQGFAEVLKRVVLTRRSEPVYRSQHGDAWLASLDAEFRTDFFTKHQGRIFGNSLYTRSYVSADESKLIADRLCQLLTKRRLQPW